MRITLISSFFAIPFHETNFFTGQNPVNHKKHTSLFEKSQRISSLKNGSKAQGDEGKRKHCRK
jgi:hypothetical protein